VALSKLTDRQPDDLLGRVVAGRYRIIELLGEGGMGSVFVAEHLGLKKEVALKVVRPEHAGNAALSARFSREAMVTSQLDHPNVISALDFGALDDGSEYLVTQLVRGQSLEDLIQNEGTLHWNRAAMLGAQIADALCAARVHGIVHRDLKPENVLVQRNGDGSETAKVLDFGIAKYARDSLAPPPLAGAQRVTQVGLVVGTPGYMAPEQAVGQRADHRSDLYALGVLLWECIVGRQLWTGRDAAEMISNQLKTTPARVRVATGDLTIPMELDLLVSQLLSSTASGRPEEPSAVRDALRELAARGGTKARSDETRRITHEAVAVVADTEQSALSAAERAAAPTRVFAPQRPRRLPTPMVSEPPPLVQPRTGRLFAALLLLASVGLYATWASGFVRRGEAGRSLALAPLPELGPRMLGLLSRAGLPSRDALGRRGGPARSEDARGTGLPAALEPQLALLVQGGTRDARVGAARSLLGHIPIDDVPPYVRALAHFQLAESCVEKRQPLSLLQALHDSRALPVLVLASERAKTGCNRRDCLACMRDDLERLITDLERHAQSQAEP
jgi:serine/threonine-protein kinase